MNPAVGTEGHRRARPSRRPRQLVRLAVVLVLLLVTAACGARWDDEQQAAVVARHEGGSGAGSSAAGPGMDPTGERTGSTVAAGQGGGDGASVAAGPGEAGAESGTGGAGDGGGDQPSADGGEGAPGAEGAGGAAPCTQPSDAPGVTDDQITLGSISTLSGPVPGLGESALAAIRAYVQFRNATGGVCGRQVTIQSADDGGDNGRFRSILNEFDSQVLAFAGGVTTGDAGGADLIDELQIPFVTTAISIPFQDAEYAFDLNPPFEDVNAPIGKYEYLVDQGVETAAVVTAALDQTRSEANKQKAQMQASGIEIVYDQELPISTLSYDSAARGVANSGADYLLFIYDATVSAEMAQSMEDTGYELMFEEYLVAYGTNFIELAGPEVAEGTTSWARFVPNEEPGTSEGQTNFLEWMERTAPGLARDNFAVDGWAAAHAVVTAIEALPGAITRDAIYQQLKSVGEYTANGLIAPIQLGPELNNGCFVAMQVRSAAWTRLTPDQGFLC